MKEKLILVFSVLLVFCFVFGSCNHDNEQKYFYELYSISSSTYSAIASWNYGNNALDYAKSQSGTSMIDNGDGLTIDDVRQKCISLGLHEFHNVDEVINNLEKGNRYYIWWWNQSIGYRIIYFNRMNR